MKTEYVLPPGASDAQREAIIHDTGPAMVVAGPGSGKTFVITHRIHFLVKSLGVSPENILVITFTKAAATQMRERWNRLCPGEDGVVFGTLHSVFYRILRSSGRYPGIGILSEAKRSGILGQLLCDEGIESDDMAELKTLIAADISRYKMRLALDGDFVPSALDPDSFMRIFEGYCHELKKQGLMDFDDMVQKTHTLLLRDSALRAKVRDRFGHILVDEFQDIDSLQYACIKLMLGRDRNLFVVGDDDQSIYAFRGATPAIMLGFEEDNPGTKRIVMDVNFRCAPCISQAASRLILNNSERLEKLVKSGRNEEGIVELPVFEGREQELEYIAGILKNRGGENGTAILARTGRECIEAGEYLMKKGIACVMKEKARDVYEHFVTKDVMAYFALAMGDDSRGNFLRIMNRPSRYIPRKNLPETIDLGKLAAVVGLSPQAAGNVKRLKLQSAMLAKMKPEAALCFVVNVMGYGSFLKEYAKENGSDPSAWDKVLGQLKEEARYYDSISQWLEASRERDMRKDKRREKEEERGVLISTLHASKGLEFDRVFIINICEGVIPYKRSVSDSAVMEERRLFYVGMTRAIRELYLCRTLKSGGRDREESRFIGEIGLPQDLGCGSIAKPQ